MSEGLPRGLKPQRCGRTLKSGLKPGPISETKAETEARTGQMRRSFTSFRMTAAEGGVATAKGMRAGWR
jgi:hypothetical protein